MALHKSYQSYTFESHGGRIQRRVTVCGSHQAGGGGEEIKQKQHRLEGTQVLGTITTTKWQDENMNLKSPVELPPAHCGACLWYTWTWRGAPKINQNEENITTIYFQGTALPSFLTGIPLSITGIRTTHYMLYRYRSVEKMRGTHMAILWYQNSLNMCKMQWFQCNTGG